MPKAENLHTLHTESEVACRGKKRKNIIDFCLTHLEAGRRIWTKIDDAPFIAPVVVMITKEKMMKVDVGERKEEGGMKFLSR